MEYMKVKDNPNLVRQKSSNAILNVNDKDLNKYKEERDQALQGKKLAEEQESLRRDVDEIKSLLKELLGKIR
jgi:uncharacterized protein YpiB (UPF0302 family)